MKTKRLLLVLIVIFIVAVTARWWLPVLLGILMINKDLIGTLDSTISIVSSLIALISAVGGYILLKNKTTTEKEESLDQRNRRILLNHVENFWVKGVLEKSLHGAAMLELGVKEDPAAVKYPWTIKKETTGETLPAGTSMLEIFDQIGMGRSLLILGAPGSGKSTMLYELARQLIERARQNADEPIPMVFNLASWTEKLSLADWLAQELNNIYYVPRKTAPDWVKENKLLLLLDGLDEVKQESRAKCVDAINQFRKEHGLTSLAVCSRSQDYGELGAKLAFEGAIEVQPLTQKQVNEFFNRFGKEMAGLKSVLKKDSALREMAETPLFLSIMVMAYRNKQDVDILAPQDVEAQLKHLLDTYIESMFDRSDRLRSEKYTRTDTLHWLSWLARKMSRYNRWPYQIEDIQPRWLSGNKISFWYRIVNAAATGLSFWLIFGFTGMLLFGNMKIGEIVGIFFGLLSFFIASRYERIQIHYITVDWTSKINVRDVGYGLIAGLIIGIIITLRSGIYNGLLLGGLICITIVLLHFIRVRSVENISKPGQRIASTVKINTMAILFLGPTIWIIGTLLGQTVYVNVLMIISLWIPISINVIKHYCLRILLSRSRQIPWRLTHFLNYCSNLIILRRVGGGYVFIHRLLMEHFASMYKETEL